MKKPIAAALSACLCVAVQAPCAPAWAATVASGHVVSGAVFSTPLSIGTPGTALELENPTALSPAALSGSIETPAQGDPVAPAVQAVAVTLLGLAPAAQIPAAELAPRPMTATGSSASDAPSAAEALRDTGASPAREERWPSNTMAEVQGVLEPAGSDRPSDSLALPARLEALYSGAPEKREPEVQAHAALWAQFWPNVGGGGGRLHPQRQAEAPAAGQPQAPADAPDFLRPPVAKIVAELRILLESDPAKAHALALSLLEDRGEKRYEVRISAVRALASLAPEAAAPALSRELAEGGNWAVRREAARQLGERAAAIIEKREEAVAALRAAVKDENASLRLAAASSLERFGETAKMQAPRAPRTARIAERAVSLAPLLQKLALWSGVILSAVGLVALIKAYSLGPMLTALFFYFGPVLLMIGFSVWMMRRQMGAGRANEKKKVELRGEKQATRFSDVGGADDAANELREIVDFLKNPEKYRKNGAKVPHGVLLEGPPGTGKTLLARAVAGEAGVPFFSMAGSEFVEMFVGVGAARVRDLFDQAKAKAPAILFIDEIDAVAKARGGINSNDEREQTLNQILTEMDGFQGNENLIVLAGTNRADVLDSAITRPGRFDRTVHVGRPDVLGREAVLQIHAKGLPLAPDVDLQQVARRTPGLTGAFLRNVANEAAIMSVRRGADVVSKDDFHKAIDRAVVGQARHLFLSRELKRRLAFHEAGHVMATVFHDKGQISHKVTIIPHGSGALGYAESGSEEEDRFLYTKTELLARLVTLMGGLVAEELIFGEWSTGPGSDLERATDIARMMVGSLGMGDKDKTGLLVARKQGDNSFFPEISEETKREVDLEARRLLDEAKKAARTLLEANRAAFDALANALLEKETLHQDEIEAVLKPYR